MESRMSRSSFAILAAQARRRRIMVKDYGSPDGSTTGDESPSDTTESFEHHSWRLSQMSPSAYDILKAVRYMRDGDQKACFTALSSMMNLDFTDDVNASAVMHEDGLELLVNLLEVNHLRCRLRALQVMKQLTENKKIVTIVVLFGIAPILVSRLIDDAKDEVALACDVIANIAHKRRAARAVTRMGGLPKLVSFLILKKELLVPPKRSLNEEEQETINLAISAGHALWKLAKFTKVKVALQKAGFIPIMSHIISVGQKSLFIPIAGVLCECTSLSWFQLAIETEGLVGRILSEAQEKDPLLQRTCCRTLMLAAHGNENVRHMMHFHKGPRKLVKILAAADPKDKPLLAAIIGAIWKTAISMENVKQFDELGAVGMIVKQLYQFDLDVMEAAAGALAELGKRASCREEMVRMGAVKILATLLARTITKLLPNVCHALQQCAKDEQGIQEIEAYDVVRRLWSLLTHPNVEVRVQAARALEPCVRYAEDSGEVLRSITNSLLLLVNLLKQNDVEFLQSVCALLAEVALDEENLGVMSEQGVAAVLSTLVSRKYFEDPKENKSQLESKSVEIKSVELKSVEIKSVLENEEYKLSFQDDRQGLQLKSKEKSREELVPLYRVAAAAIANCSSRADNRHRFGSLGAIPRLVQFLNYGDTLLQAQCCRALHALSFNAANCVTIHSCNAVTSLLRAIGSSNEMTQLGAAGCMYNLRNLLLRADRPERKTKKRRLSSDNTSLHD